MPRQAILELHTSSERSFSRLNEILTLSSQLSDDIRSLLAGLSVGNLFHEVVDRVQSELQRMGVGTGPASSKSTESDPM